MADEQRTTPKYSIASELDADEWDAEFRKQTADDSWSKLWCNMHHQWKPCRKCDIKEVESALDSAHPVERREPLCRCVGEQCLLHPNPPNFREKCSFGGR